MVFMKEKLEMGLRLDNHRQRLQRTLGFKKVIKRLIVPALFGFPTFKHRPNPVAFSPHVFGQRPKVMIFISSRDQLNRIGCGAEVVDRTFFPCSPVGDGFVFRDALNVVENLRRELFTQDLRIDPGVFQDVV